MDMDESFLRRRQRSAGQRPVFDGRLGGAAAPSDKATDWTLASDIHWTIYIVLLLLVGQICVFFDGKLPTPKDGGGDDAVGGPEFSEVRARRFLSSLVNLGPRPSGSEACEVKAKALILSQVDDIKKTANKLRFIDVDVQKPTGCFALNFLDKFVMCYKNLTNVIVRLGDSAKPKPSLLINCHFDSVASSPGASDDAVSCAVMMEILRVISSSSKPLPHDLVFLFNGAEENILQASHGFITQHKLRHYLRAFINLESAGAGGREILFQISRRSTWILDGYIAKAPYPHTSVIGHELFQSGVLPAETDFRIFRDFGHLSGVDMAFVKNGYVYHNEFDRDDYIDAGSIQRVGENVLALIDVITESPCFDGLCPEDVQHGVFFDVLGLFCISYSYNFGLIFNGLVCTMVMAQFYFATVTSGQPSVAELKCRPWYRRYSKKSIGLCLLAHMLSCVSCLATSLIVQRFLKSIESTLVWYGKPSAMVGLYVAPSLLVGLVVHHVFSQMFRRKHAYHELQLEQCVFNVGMVLLAIPLLVLTCFKFRSAYYLTFILLFQLIRSPLMWILGCFDLFKTQFSSQLFTAHVSVSLPSFVFVVYGFVEIQALMIPILGRVGPVVDSEKFIACFGVIMSWLIVVITAPLVYYSRRLRWFYIFAVSSILYLLVVASTPYGIPFVYDLKNPRLRRLHIQHFTRAQCPINNSTICSKEHGLWLYPLDARGVRDLPPYEVISKGSIPECNMANPFCDLPYYIPVHRIFPPGYSLLSKLDVGPHAEMITKVTVLRRSVERENRSVSFEIVLQGSDHMNLFITPADGWFLSRCSLGVEIEKQMTTLYMAFNCGHSPCEWAFNMTFSTNHTMPTVDFVTNFVVSSRFIHGIRQFSEQLNNLVAKVLEDREASVRNSSLWRSRMTMEVWSSEVVVTKF